MGLLSARGPGRTRAGLHLWGLLPQLALQVLRDQVGLVMLGEVVTPHEALLTLGTLCCLLDSCHPCENKPRPAFRKEVRDTRSPGDRAEVVLQKQSKSILLLTTV